ncbi:MAG: hypothetical protein IT169_06585 [Bryobacterales bacterium]|nr:hypothetical protein [Bryobacterales bacterium]HEU0139296.1 hypothetical protein [Bryobacteraceae bacterium]
MVRKFLQHVVPGVIRPLRVLWNQVIGFVFLAFAVFSSRSIYTAVKEYDGDAESLFRVVLTGFFGAIMAYFGVFSFLRARRISRS